VTLGYDTLEGYLTDKSYMGAIIGRFGNRIAGGRFVLEGTEYSLLTNNPPNHLHGGQRGFDKVIWDVDRNAGNPGRSLVLSYRSRDGEEGYPGTLSTRVVYSITDEDEFTIVYAAATDRSTVINLTHHSYFNLAGAGHGDILAHQLFIDADFFTPIDGSLIPTGEVRSVRGTPMDFTKPATIGDRISAEEDQLRLAGGYDHNWVLKRGDGQLRLAAVVHERGSGRFMGVFTTEPGIQFYSGNFLDGSAVGKRGMRHIHRAGFCLETQHFPDSPNNPQFPTTVLNPGDVYTSTTIYRFTTR
jgi:aldose 1-epimerase